MRFPRYPSQEIGSVNIFGSLDEEDEDPSFSAPPNAPPPPPPLNLPPTRARRQFAARLARRKQNQEREMLARQEESSQQGAHAEFGQVEEDGRFTIESDDGDADEFVPDVDVQPSLLSSFQRFFRSSGKPSPSPSLLLSPSLNHPLFTPGSWSSLSSPQSQSQSSPTATTSAPPGAQSPTEEDADLGLKRQQPSPPDDEVDASGGKMLSPRRPRPMEATRRELLEPEDEEEYDGDVVDFGREKADEMEDEEEREDLVEIKPPRKGQLSLEPSPTLALSPASGSAESVTERSFPGSETASSPTADSHTNCVTAVSGHGEKQLTTPVEDVPAVSLSAPIREFSSF